VSRQAPFPSDDMIVLAVLLEGETARCAEEIASVLRRLGFVISPQKMAATLRRLCREDCPMIEARDDEDWRLKFYSVTPAGHCQLGNRYPRLQALERAS
jgi:DNA-binding PadR family transcriptional regulator